MDGDEEEYGEEEYESEDDDPLHQDMMNLIDRKNLEQNQTLIDWDQVLEVLGTELPKIPAPPEVEQINPPHEEMARIHFGKLKPVDKDAKNKKKK